MFYKTDDLKNDEIFLKLIRTVDENIEKGYVPAYYFNICNTVNHVEIGHCDLRIGHNHNTYFGGNIGYGIDEPYRGKNYAGKACLLLLELAKKHQMKYLYITCNPNNYASRRTCEYAGGILEEIVKLPVDNEMYIGGDREKCHYRIDIVL